MKKREEPVWEKPQGEALRPINEQFEWKTRDPLPPGQSRNPGRLRGWQPRRPLQPMDRSMGEATMLSLGIRHSAPIPHATYMEVNVELEKLKEERQALEGTREKFEQYEKRLVLIVTRLDRAEERIGKALDGLENLESVIQSFSTLVSRMENLLNYYEVNRR